MIGLGLPRETKEMTPSQLTSTSIGSDKQALCLLSLLSQAAFIVLRSSAKIKSNKQILLLLMLDDKLLSVRFYTACTEARLSQRLRLQCPLNSTQRWNRRASSLRVMVTLSTTRPMQRVRLIHKRRWSTLTITGGVNNVSNESDAYTYMSSTSCDAVTQFDASEPGLERR